MYLHTYCNHPSVKFTPFSLHNHYRCPYVTLQWEQIGLAVNPNYTTVYVKARHNNVNHEINSMFEFILVTHAGVINFIIVQILRKLQAYKITDLV